MKITDVKGVLLQAPTGGLEWIGGRIETWDTALVVLETDAGTTGLGEVGQGMSAAPSVPGLVRTLRPFLLGQDPTRPRQLRHRLVNWTQPWARGGVAAGVLAAAEIASWDIAAQAHGVPLYQLLGGLCHDELPVYASAGLGASADEVVSGMQSLAGDGFRYIKIRALRSAAETMQLLDRVESSGVTATARLMLDAVQGWVGRPWSFRDVVRVGRRLEELNAVFYEEPLRSDDIDGYARLRRTVNVPLAGVETYPSPTEFARLIDGQGVDVVQPDATIVGGVEALHAVASMAMARNVRVIPHTWASGVSAMANFHAAFSHPGVEMLELNTYAPPLLSELLTEPLRLADGVLRPPTQPGLGVRLTPDIVERYPFTREGEGILVTR